MLSLSDEQIRRMEIDALKLYIRRRIGGYRVAIKKLTIDNRLYRGVLWPNRPTEISQLWHPPPGVSPMGRVNRRGVPMFYCSRAAASVFYEMRVKESDRVALSEWQVAEPFLFHHLGFDTDLMQAIGAPPRLQLQGLIQNETSRNRRIRRALSLPFTEQIGPDNEHRYKQTIAINELLFDRTSLEAAGTVYPSMGMKGAADNVALWPHYVERVLRPVSVRYVLVESADVSSSAYSFKTLAISTCFSNGDIQWQDRVPDDTSMRSSITFEGNSWVLRDGSGRTYDVH